MAYVPTWRERLEDAKPYALPAVAGLIVLGVASWVVWHTWEPPAQPGARAVPKVEAAAPPAPTAVRDEVEPLRVAVENALTLARAAATQERWDDALKSFNEARAAQAEINARFPGSPAADAGKPGRIDAEIADLRASGLAAAGLAREREGDAAVAAGRTQEAAASLAAAIDLQREMIAKFPRSRATSVTRLDELTAKRDTVLAAALLRQAAAQEREIDGALARRQTVAAREKISAAVALLDEVREKFPRTAGRDGPWQTKLAWLGARRGELDALQAEVYARLAPLPGAEEIRMLKTEVPQALFLSVMGSNPSRNVGGALPVDSVSWIEAKEFCLRISWLLGRRVHLPTEAEFRVAAGERGEIWSSETSGGRTHAAGEAKPSPAGFHDMRGNLAEWLDATDDASEAPVAGGSYLDAPGAMAALPVAAMDKRERARHIGFRVVVEPAGP